MPQLLHELSFQEVAALLSLV